VRTEVIDQSSDQLSWESAGYPHERRGKKTKNLGRARHFEDCFDEPRDARNLLL
jgi:hypothetical protein